MRPGRGNRLRLDEPVPTPQRARHIVASSRARRTKEPTLVTISGIADPSTGRLASRDYTEVGNGTIDFTRIWPDASLAGLKHFFVEQGGNFTYDPFRSVADSAEYVKRVLLK